MSEEITGRIERITFTNEDTGYTVAKMKVRGSRDLVTVVGGLPAVIPGEMLRLQGVWDSHPKYGNQFRISSFETVLPATVQGIERYLGSGLIKGIGPVMAKRLVAKFGQDTLTVIDAETERLREVEGIGAKRMEMIRQAWTEQKEIRDLMLFLQGHGVSASYASRIFRQYGKQALQIVRQNPYRLAEDIFGVGFLTADSIAKKLGMAHDSPVRAGAGISHTLNMLAGNGHVCYPRDGLIEEAVNILDIERSKVEAALERIMAEKKVVIEDGMVFLSALHSAEAGVADSLLGLLSGPKNAVIHDQTDLADRIRSEMKITLADRQVEAVRAALDNKVLVITGGPGTGKTTIIRSILRMYASAGRRILLAAPTGRAAKRMAEATGYEAKTVHRLLEFSPKGGGFKRDEGNPLDVDLLVVDEVSMVDTVLMGHLLKAVPETATLVLVGDADQLPSVGPGTVLRDLIDSGMIPTVRLSEIFRQAGQGLIVINAHRVNKGEFPIISSDREALTDFYFIEIEDPESVSEKILDMCSSRIPSRFGLRPLDDIQVLAPMHRGATGTASLNAALQKGLNPDGEELSRGGKTLRIGDKVMQIRNNYDRDVYNGDIGRITGIDTETQELTVEYDGRSVAYDFADLDEIVLAYAVSVHKSQGSEYPAVVMPILTQHYMMLQRNLLYTAITRGRKLVLLIGTKKALAMAVKNNKPTARHTRLKERLRGGLG